MGGEPDGEGAVDATKLIRTIKEEFEMTIDIEKLIEEIDEDGSGQIEFGEFMQLLQSGGNKGEDDEDENWKQDSESNWQSNNYKNEIY